ncbi:MAG TPA: hypothetical protein VD902_13070, partial [Symbiobacteriaceae bacterium]|nr:hypothetical protein [Symbiobacteriaceae bacterium]
SDSYVQVEALWSPAMANTTNISPRTHYTNQFMPAPRPGAADLENGMLRLSEPDEFAVVQVDVDGAALKVMDFTNSALRALLAHRSADTPDRYSMPALRSGGLSLVRIGRAIGLVDTLRLSKLHNTQAEAGGAVDLYAQDLTRGYRIDIWDDRSGQWRSLHRRQGIYKFTNGGVLVSADDEGVVTMGVSESADGAKLDLYLHESMVTWQGWSLSAPRYGKMVDNDDAAATPPSEAPPEFGLETAFTPAPRSLPRLRYGTSYRMRARAADLAGNSVPYDSPDESTATPPQIYTRMEPVPSPMTLLRAATTPGESVERLVIRSNYDTPAGGVNERHVAPPRVSQIMAETHGMFDTGAGLDKAAYDLIVAREGSFSPDAVVPEAQLALPYLPDPLARGAAFRGLPGTAPQAFTHVAFDGGWPDRMPFRLVVEEGAGAPAWDAASRVLRVKLPKGEMFPVRLSAHLDADGLGVMGLWQWLQEAGLSDPVLAQIRNLALRGGHWMLTPHRYLMLVHAVQQPLLVPAYQGLSASRSLGDTFAVLKDNVQVSGKSTDKLDVLAAWDEPVDILSEPGPRVIAGQAHAGEVKVLYGQTETPLNLKHDFGDTKYRRVRYDAVATSRYKEYFYQRASDTVTLTGLTAAPLSHTLLVEGKEEVRSGDAVLRRDVDYTLDYAAGTVSRLEGGAITSGDTVTASYTYLPGPVTRATPAPTAVDVLNAARPSAPRVLYVVPTFGWSREELAEGNGSVALKRSGGGLRIYLDRPWYSSGEGELLGAVLWVRPSGGLIRIPPRTPPEPLKPFVTQWGMDPIWLSNATYAVPGAGHFPLAVDSRAGVTLAEVPGATVAVAGHQVGYDDKRQLWYCDMEVDAGSSYWPFVRLALARYQPMSVAHAHLSRIVLADFAQLAPERVASLIFDPDRPDLVAVNVCGPGYRQSGVGRGASQLEVTVETRVPGREESSLAWVAATDSIYPLTLREDDGDQYTWAGGVALPGDRGEKPYRLVIREYERFAADGVFLDYAALNLAAPQARRLVYAAVLEI